MAKKIRFPLSLSDGTQARTLDELKEHFDLESVLGHYKSGKLLTWLRDRYEETEADAVEALDEAAPDFQQKLCAAFGVEFSGSGVDMEEIARRQKRMKKLREFTDEDEFIQNIDAVAFDQEELIDLLDEGCEKIYLCGEKFKVPASEKGKTYIGVNSPKVYITGTIGADWEEHNIAFAGCEAVNLPKKEIPVLLPAEESVQQPLPMKPVRITINSKNVDVGGIKGFADALREMVGEDYYRKNIGATNDAFDRFTFFASERVQATKNIGDIYPVFLSEFKEADIFAKLWVANQTLGENLYYRIVAEIRMKDSDKFMIMQMSSQYDGLWKLKDLDIKLVDGIPEGIRNDSYIIAKEILHKPLNVFEKGRLTQIRNMFTR